MDVVYVRSLPGSVPVDERINEQVAKRRWPVSVRVNHEYLPVVVVEDPFPQDEYETVLEAYLKSSDRPRWSLSLSLEGGADRLAHAEDRIRWYGEALADQLGLRAADLSAAECHVYVVEHQHAPDDAPGIHSLAWELLEAVSLPRHPKLRLRVTRVSDFAEPPGGGPGLPQSLSAAQADPGAVFKVLLVVARDFSRRGADRDPEPDLAQWPLMKVHKRLRSRMLLEVVRPGSCEMLEEHLRVRAEQDVRFDLVHFDLHGRIMPDERGIDVPWLLFARRHRPSDTDSAYQAPQTHLAKAETVADLLARHGIGTVVLNACLSAYNRAGPTTNLAHLFLRRGVRHVSAMWFYVHWQTVATYLDAFYDHLLVRNLPFHAAAHAGREAIRLQPTSRTGRTYHDFFLCVNYTRGRPSLGDPALPTHSPRDPSPAPSMHSQDSSGSNASGRSMRSAAGRWAQRRQHQQPRLSDSLLPPAADEPVMRMQLHLLELEYKLVAFRVVYASDLRRAGSDLAATMDRMAAMWLATNLIDEVLYYKAKDFAKHRALPTPRERRVRTSASAFGGGGVGAGLGFVRQLLLSRPVRALRQTLHVVREVDGVVDPGTRADELENRRGAERARLAQEGLQRLAQRLHGDAPGTGQGFLLLLGSQDAQWWATYLQHLDGGWWRHLPWNYTVHSPYARDVRFLG